MLKIVDDGNERQRSAGKKKDFDLPSSIWTLLTVSATANWIAKLVEGVTVGTFEGIVLGSRRGAELRPEGIAKVKAKAKLEESVGLVQYFFLHTVLYTKKIFSTF